jgi:hypothetical protein
MTQIEQDIAEIKTSLAEIKKVLGIGLTAPANIIDIRRRATQDAEFLKRKSKHHKDLSQHPSVPAKQQHSCEAESP